MDRVGPGLIAGLAILPGAMAVSMAFFYLGDWPTKNPFDQVFYGTVAGASVWIVFSAVFLRGFADVENGDPATFDELVVRKASLVARLHALGGTAENPGRDVPEAEASGVSERIVALPETGVVTARVSAEGGPAQETRQTA